MVQIVDLFDKLVMPEEGYKPKVYDDATGQAIVPGYLVKGHPTIGIGRALDVHGLSDGEINTLYQNDKESVMSAVVDALPWLSTVTGPRQNVLFAMAFQMGLGKAGVSGLLAFERMLAAVQAGHWQLAHDEMLASAWAAQTPARAQRMAAIMLSGNVA